ncbi:leukocyte elastase inhibitor-like [Arapaima gigas]
MIPTTGCKDQRYFQFRCSTSLFAVERCFYDGKPQQVYRGKRLKAVQHFSGSRTPTMDSLSIANIHFTLDLFQKISSENQKNNVFFSPFSISSALAMVLLGARGNTAKQMSQCLHFYRTEGNIHINFNKLFSQLNKPETPYALSIANRLYGEKSQEFDKKFLADTEKHYRAELVPEDFVSNAETARVNINTWVEKQTQDKIKDLLAKGVLDSQTKLVLVNAIYFKGTWEDMFDEKDTKEKLFKLNKTGTKPVKMMYQKEWFPLTFIPQIRCQILEMPYVGKELSMFFMLPTEIEDDSTGLEKLEKNLTYENLTVWLQPVNIKEVVVELPKFHLEETYDLKKILVSMGMVNAFDSENCDLSGISPKKDLMLSKVVHKAFVEVNEKGTEAAAATAVKLVPCCASRPAYFIADHPFLFFIRHNPTKSILFCGRFCSP